MDPTERSMLEAAAHDAFAAAGDRPLDDALATLGWPEMLVAEPRDSIGVVFTALGRANGAATALDDVVAAGLGLRPRPALAVLLPAFSHWRPPGRLEGGRVRAEGLATARVTTAGELLVVCGPGDGSGAAHLVAVPVAAAAAQPRRGIDPGAGLHAVRVDHPAEPSGTVPWDAAVALARRALGHQIAGAARAMLDLARAHALDRVQFGRPIARFQAVRHRLAEALVWVEALEASLVAAADAPGPETAALAKAVAGRAAAAVAAHCQQVLAGIGFTTDHPFHRHLRRTLVLDGLFGSADAIALDLGRRLVARRRVPTLVEL